MRRRSETINIDGLKACRLPRRVIGVDTPAFFELIGRYKADPESDYRTWFIDGEERMKAFRAIRRGVKDTVDAIAAGAFGNDFKAHPWNLCSTPSPSRSMSSKGRRPPSIGSPSSASLRFTRKRLTNRSSVRFSWEMQRLLALRNAHLHPPQPFTEFDGQIAGYRRRGLRLHQAGHKG